MMRFVVHEHRATRLHYDFRLEMVGALKSWAIPKGPSMNPADKRLAVEVADHPVDYIDFEGIIPKESYGAGPVVVWDAGGCEPIEAGKPEAQLQAGKFSFALKGKNLEGGFTLTRLARSKTGKDWLLIKKKDAHADPSWTLKTELTRQRLKALRVKNPSCETE